MKIKLMATFTVLLIGGIAYAAGNAPGSNYREQGGITTVIGGALNINSGGTLDVKSGATLKIASTTISATAAEINTNLDGVATTYSLSAAAESGNVITATVTYKDANAVAVAQ